MSKKELNWNIIDDLPMDEPQEYGLAPEPITIANGDDMDANTDTTSCNAKISQFCLFEQSNCFIGENGLASVNASALPVFNDLYPECTGASVDSDVILQPIQLNQGYLYPKSPNFLGGPMMRQAIMVLLGIAILFVVSKGKPIKATAKAIKKAL